MLILAVLISGYTFNVSSVAKAKKTKKNYKKVYNFTVEGNCDNADADIIWDSSDPDEHSLYRKIAVPEIKTGNMPKVELFKKYTPYSGFSGGFWQPTSAGYFTDGYVWIWYADWDGSDDPGQNCPKDYNAGNFRLFVY